MLRFLTIQAVAWTLAVSTRTVRRLINAGELPAIKVRGALRVSEEDLLRYIKKQHEKFTIEKFL